MTTADYCYPEFVEGQVLTHLDLNMLRAHFDARVLFHAKMLGFGVGCGLRGSVLTGPPRVRISAGWAIAADGFVLRAGSETTTRIARIRQTAGAASDFSFLEAHQGFTAVLRRREEKKPTTGPCTEAECRRQSTEICHEPEIVWAKGRLARVDMPNDAVFDLKPVQPSVRIGDLRPAFNRLRRGLLRYFDRLDASERAVIGTPAIEKLGRQEMDGDAISASLLRAGLVNELLFVAWELERCRWLRGVGCEPRGGTLEIALGWLHEASAGWTWDCAFRHDFQLSRMLLSGVHGWGCGDECVRFLLRIRSLIETFTVPETPPPTPPDPPDDPPVCTIEDLIKGRCHWKEPIPVDDWPILVRWPIDPFHPYDPIRPPVTFPPDPGWIDPIDPYVNRVREGTAIDPGDGTVLPVAGLLGAKADKVKDVVTEFAKGSVADPVVEVVTLNAFTAREDVDVTLFAAPGDEIVVAKDSAGATAAIGVKRAAALARDVGGKVAEVGQQLTDVKADVETLVDSLPEGATLRDLGQSVRVLESWPGTKIDLLAEVDGLIQKAQTDALPGLVAGELGKQFDTFKAGIDDRFGKLDQKIDGFDTTAREKIGAVGQRVAAVETAQGALGTSLETLEDHTGQRIADVTRSVDAVEKTTRQQLSSFGKTIDARFVDLKDLVKSENGRFGRELRSELGDQLRALDQIGALEAKLTRLEQDNAELTQRMERHTLSMVRAVGTAARGPEERATVEANDALLESLETVRKSIDQPARRAMENQPAPRRREVEKALEELGKRVADLRVAQRNVALVRSQPGEVAAAMSGVAAVVGKLPGVRAADKRLLTNTIKDLERITERFRR